MPFSQTHVPYSFIYTDDIDHSITGVFVLYHLKKILNEEDIIPIYLGYGNIVTELKRIEHHLMFLSPEPLYYDFIADPKEPETVLSELRTHYKPILSIS